MRAPTCCVAMLAALIASIAFTEGTRTARAAETGHGAAAAEITTLRDGAGRDLTTGRCIICHSVEYIPSNAPAMNRVAWQKTIQKMREKFGAPITDEEAQEILDYLAANYSGKGG
jgi:sulfite dehydrogenase (cytochrome) subunit B